MAKGHIARTDIPRFYCGRSFSQKTMIDVMATADLVPDQLFRLIKSRHICRSCKKAIVKDLPTKEAK